jgi:excisionase family DNA binding protein
MSSLLTTQQAAELLNVSPAFLERNRCQGADIPFIKVGSRAVRYRLSDLEAYLDGQVRYNTIAMAGG